MPFAASQTLPPTRRLGGRLPWLAFGLAFSLYYGALALRHAWLQTSSWDLGIFHQAIFLLSRAEEPLSTFLGYHVLGDHAALVLYPLAVIYRLFPSVQLLFVLQSAALASAVFPLHALGVRRGLAPGLISASLAVLLLYPVVFNTAIFDFHPETLAFPLLAQVILLIESPVRGSAAAVVVLLALALTCKETMAILVIGIAIWLWLRRRRGLAMALFVLGVAWLMIAGLVVIPGFGGEAAGLPKHLVRFGLQQGQSGHGGLLGKAGPGLGGLFRNLISLANLEYILLMVLPVLWLPLHRSRWRLLAGLIPFAPLLLINLLADVDSMKNLVHHYSLFLVPFLVNQFQLTLRTGPSGLEGYPLWLRQRVVPISIGWSLLAFLSLSRVGAFFGQFQSSFDNGAQARMAIELVDPEAPLLATNALAAQRSDRRLVEISQETSLDRLDHFKQVLLDRRHPGFLATPELVDRLLNLLRQDSSWEVVFAEEDIYLFRRKESPAKVIDH